MVIFQLTYVILYKIHTYTRQNFLLYVDWCYFISSKSSSPKPSNSNSSGSTAVSVNTAVTKAVGVNQTAASKAVTKAGGVDQAAASSQFTNTRHVMLLDKISIDYSSRGFTLHLYV